MHKNFLLPGVEVEKDTKTKDDDEESLEEYEVERVVDYQFCKLTVSRLLNLRGNF